MSEQTSFCHCCGDRYPLDALDAKPSAIGPALWFIRLIFGQRRMLSWAADHGADFDRLECHACYGDGYEAVAMTPTLQASDLDVEGLVELQDMEFMREDGHVGDCVRAATATLLGLDRAEVPHFVRDHSGYWRSAWEDWLEARGLAVVEIDPRVRPGHHAEAMYLACGPTERSGPGEHPAAHMVVMKGIGLFHDPHPSRAGLTTIDRVYVVFPSALQSLSAQLAAEKARADKAELHGAEAHAKATAEATRQFIRAQAAERKLAASEANLAAANKQIEEMRGERPVAWRVRYLPGHEWRYLEDDPERMPSVRDYERQRLYARTALSHEARNGSGAAS